MRHLFCILIVSTWLPACHTVKPTVPDRRHQEECLAQFSLEESETAIEAECEGEEFVHTVAAVPAGALHEADFHVVLNSVPRVPVVVDSRGCRPPPTV
ncbi:MAG: hypothetical protein ACOVRM_11160 [Planctomycetaceae bacterium]|jgi:hypothetical protein